MGGGGGRVGEEGVGEERRQGVRVRKRGGEGEEGGGDRGRGKG